MVCAVVSVTLLIAQAQPHAAQPPTDITADESKARYENTDYNEDMGLIKDHRTISLKEGVTTLEFTDVAAQIDPTSVHFVSLTDPDGVGILEQDFQYDLANADKLLEKCLGKRIRIRQRVGEQERVIEGNLLSPGFNTSKTSWGDPYRYGTGGIVLNTDDGVVIDPVGQIELPKLPEGLITKPTLVWTL